MSTNNEKDPRSKDYKLNGLYFSQKIPIKKISNGSRDPLFEVYREFNYLINAYKSPKTISNPTIGRNSKAFDLGVGKITSYIDENDETFNVELVYKDGDVKDLIDIILKYFKDNNLFKESREKVNEFKRLYSNNDVDSVKKYSGTNDNFNNFFWNGFTILKFNPEIKENAYNKSYPKTG